MTSTDIVNLTLIDMRSLHLIGFEIWDPIDHLAVTSDDARHVAMVAWTNAFGREDTLVWFGFKDVWNVLSAMYVSVCSTVHICACQIMVFRRRKCGKTLPLYLITSKRTKQICRKRDKFKYKVVQMWPGQTVTCLHTNSPGHIWTTLYIQSNL
jgi:hypothetical protein